MSRRNAVQVANNTDEIRVALDNAINNGLEKIGLAAEGYAKLKCPVDTGRLRNSISHDVREDEKTVYVGTNVEYAPYVEMGTSRHPEAKPFLKPAATDHTEEYKSIVEQFLKGV